MTLMQSEKPGWFLSRAFQFTLRLTQIFLRKLCNNYEKELEALDGLVSRTDIGRGTPRFPSSTDEFKHKLMSDMAHLTNVLGIQTASKPDEQEQERVSSFFLSATPEEVRAATKSRLLDIMCAVGHPIASILRKAQMVGKFLQLHQHVTNGLEEVAVQRSSERSEEEKDALRKKKLLNALYGVSLDSWVMKPLVGMAGMNEGTVNEEQLLEALPASFKNHLATVGDCFFSFYVY